MQQWNLGACTGFQSPQEPRYGDEVPGRIIVLIALLGWLFLLDIISTQVILSYGGIELNPLMVGIVADPALHTAVKGSVLLLVIAVSLFAEKKFKGSSLPFYAVLIIMYTMVVSNNLIVLA